MNRENEKPEEAGTYKKNVHCNNCGFRGEVKIPKGFTISERKCPECGCATLAKTTAITY